MSAFGWPPLPPLSAFVSNWLTPPPPFVSFRQLLGSAPFVQQTLPKTFWNDNMGDIHLLGSNLHVIWLCPMFKVKFTSILLWIHNFRTTKLPLLKIFLTPPPLVSNWLTPPPPFVSICRNPPLPADVMCEQPLVMIIYLKKETALLLLWNTFLSITQF